MNRRNVLFCLVFISVLLCIVGCSKNNEVKEAESTKVETVAKQKKTEDVDLFFFHRWPNDPKFSMFQDLVKEYEAENPGVHIDMDCILNDQYKEKIRMIVSSNDVPDLFSSWAGTFAQEMIDSGNVKELNYLYEEDPEWAKNIAPASIDGFTFDGKIYGIPWSQDGKVFFYNKNIFKELGLEIPETWNEFIALLDTLKAAGYEMPIVAGLAEQWEVLHYMGSMNQRMIDPETLAKDYDPATGTFTDPGYVEVLRKWEQLTGYMGDICNALDHQTARNTYFAMQDTPIMYLQLCEIPMLDKVIDGDFEYGFFNFPVFEEGKGDPDALTGAPEGFMISTTSEHPEECADFLKWLVSGNRAQMLSTRCGDLTSVAGVLSEENATPAQLEAIEIIQDASVLAPWFDNACNAAVYVVYGQGAQAIATGDATPESVMKDVRKAAEALH